MPAPEHPGLQGQNECEDSGALARQGYNISGGTKDLSDQGGSSVNAMLSSNNAKKSHDK